MRAGAEAGGWPGLTMLAAVCVGWFIGLIAMIRLWKHTMWDTEDEGDEDAEDDEAPAEIQDADSGDEAAAPVRRMPATLTAPAVIFAAASMAMFFGYQPLAQIVDRAVVGLIDTRGYVEAVLGSDAIDGEYMVPPLDPDAEFRPLAGDDAAETVGAERGDR